MRQIPLEEMSALVGQEVGVSDWVEIDQVRVDKFADATDDHQWIHVDVERATAEIGGPIAHGYLTLSLVPMLTAQIIEVTGVSRGINYGCNTVRFTNVVRVGRRVRMRMKMLSSEKRGAKGLQVVMECTIEIEGETRPACVAETVGILYGR